MRISAGLASLFHHVQRWNFYMTVSETILDKTEPNPRIFFVNCRINMIGISGSGFH